MCCFGLLSFVDTNTYCMQDDFNPFEDCKILARGKLPYGALAPLHRLDRTTNP